MKAYRQSAKLKLGLIVFAGMIAVASLAYTNHLVERLRDRETFVIQLWAGAQEYLATASRYDNPYLPVFSELEDLLLTGFDGAAEAGSGAALQIPSTIDRAATTEEYRRALAWARSMPPPGEVTLASEIVLQAQFGIPAIITDSTRSIPIAWHNVPVPDTIDDLEPDERESATATLIGRIQSMAQTYDPIEIELGAGDQTLKQYIFYGDSRLVQELRIYPYVQMAFVGLFVLVGYLGFSYVRRSEQSSLWVGMAKEAAHQLGTPISSLMGWVELMKMDNLPEAQKRAAVEEVEKDVARLVRVTGRFSDIGSLPKLEITPVAPVIEATADYMRRRMPQEAKHVHLDVSVPSDLEAPLNAELFEWVIENLLKNALDAMEGDTGTIQLTAFRANGNVSIDVKDSGRGIDRRNWKNVFRPGYSTKKRGWGLGLSLAKRIVEDYHGGSLTLAQSRVGHGSTFRITIPATSTS